MKEFHTSTHLLTDNDIESLNKITRKARSSLIKYVLISICLPFLLPLFPSRNSHSWATFDLSYYWIIVLISAIFSLVFITVVLMLYISKAKSIREDLSNNTKQKLSTTIDNDGNNNNNNNNITSSDLQIFAANAGGSKNDIEDLRFFCSNLKAGDKLVIEYATKSKTILTMTKQ